MQQGDLVVRKSYGEDVLFSIIKFEQQTAIIRGIEYRLLADAPIFDLRIVNESESLNDKRGYQDKAKQFISQISGLNKSRVTQPYFEVPGKVLHFDGDAEYMRKSMAMYGELRVPAEGYYIPEENMPDALGKILPRVKPDIIVITGHDGLLKERQRSGDVNSLHSYKNSANFVEAVKAARIYERNRDNLTVIAGACQSHFEALLYAGANFASSPARILIHALDPVYIAARVAYTPIKDTLNMSDVMNQTVSGLRGIGGIESRGTYRTGMPRF